MMELFSLWSVDFIPVAVASAVAAGAILGSLLAALSLVINL